MQPVNQRRIVAVDTETHIVVLAVALGLTDRSGRGGAGVVGTVAHFHKDSDFGILHVEGVAQEARNYRGVRVPGNVEVVLTHTSRRKGTGLTHTLTGLHRGVN